MMLDTNIIISITNGDKSAMEFISNLMTKGVPISVSAVAWMEFCNGVPHKDSITAMKTSIEDNIIPFQSKEAEISSMLYLNTGQNKKHLNDCMIAATAITQGLPLATQNTKDFKKFSTFGLKLEELPSI